MILMITQWARTDDWALRARRPRALNWSLRTSAGMNSSLRQELLRECCDDYLTSSTQPVANIDTSPE
jgi:hypothetical protein